MSGKRQHYFNSEHSDSPDSPNNTNETDSREQERTVPSQDRTVISQDRTVPSQERTATSQDRTVPSQDRTVISQDRTVISQDRTVISQERTAGARGRSASSAAGYLSAATIIGNYEILSFLGAGAAGQVYKVRKLSGADESDYALKIMMGQDVSELAIERFRTEVLVISRLSHQNVVQVHDSGVHPTELGAMPYYVMDYVDGQTLSDIIKKGSRQGLPLLEALDMFAAVAHALYAAHKINIIHRDIKPGNIVLSNSKGFLGDRVKVVDFGIAKLAGRDHGQSLTDKGEIFGSPLYMSPEQCVGGRVDARSDIYSLGCTLYEALTGTPPLQGRNSIETFTMHREVRPQRLSERRPDKKFPPELEDFVDQLLEKLPDDRVQTMLQVVEIIEEIREASTPKKAAAQAQTRRTRKPVRATNLSEEEARPVKKVFTMTMALVLGTLITGLSFVIYTLISIDQKAKELAIPPEAEHLTHGEDVTSMVDTAKKKQEIVTQTPSTTILNPNEIKPGCFYKGEVDVDGEQMSEFEFPSKESAGTIGFAYGGNNRKKKKTVSKTEIQSSGFRDLDDLDRIVDRLSERTSINAKVKDKVRVPTGSHMSFMPLRAALKYPEFMKGFRPDDIDELKLNSVKTNISKLIESAADAFPYLHILYLEGSGASDKDIETINRFQNLHELYLRASHVTTNGALNLKRLERFSILSLSDLKSNVSQLIERLSQSNHLRSLIICKTKLSTADLKRLTESRSLLAVTFVDCNITYDQLTSIAPYSNWVDVRVGDLNCTTEQALALVKSFRRIAAVHIYNKKWSRQEREKLEFQLKKILPEKASITLIESRPSSSLEAMDYLEE